MSRRASLALALSALVALLILVGGLIPSSWGQGPVRRDGPILHGLSFALLVLPLVAVWPRRWWAIVIGAALFGVGLEGLQMFTDRATELSDMVSNCVGALIGAGVGWGVSRVLRASAGRSRMDQG
jgi:VanZ family protein